MYVYLPSHIYLLFIVLKSTHTVYLNLKYKQTLKFIIFIKIIIIQSIFFNVTSSLVLLYKQIHVNSADSASCPLKKMNFLPNRPQNEFL